jgi:hypothetical protein
MECVKISTLTFICERKSVFHSIFTYYNRSIFGNMQRTLLSILLVFGVFAAGAQTVSMNPMLLSTEFDLVAGEHQTIILNGTMTSAGTEDNVSYDWTKEILAGPRDWDISFCDNTRCWLPFVNAGSVTLIPNVPGTADVHLETVGLGVPGDSCIVRITVSETGNPDNTAQAVFRFYAKNTTPIVEVDGADDDLILYPNPATDYFHIKGSLDVGQITLFNYVGREVRNYAAADNGSYSLDGLKTGMYLARIYNDSGIIIRTVRLHKR